MLVFLHYCNISQEVHTAQLKSLTIDCDIGHPTLLRTVQSAELKETQTEKLIKQFFFHPVVEFKLSRYNTAAKFCS